MPRPCVRDLVLFAQKLQLGRRISSIDLFRCGARCSESMSRRTLIVTVGIGVLALVAVVIGPRLELPTHLNPWSPLRLDEPPNFLTRYKLDRASNDATACRTALEQAPWRYSPIADEVTRPGCGYTNAVRIEHMDVAVNEPFAVSCRAALSLAFRTVTR